MSSLLVCTPAALGRPFTFGPKPRPELVLSRLAAQVAGVTPASHLEVRPAPEMVSSGIPELDVLTGGLPRGCLTEVCGAASSGRTSLLLAALSTASRRQEVCALVDACDAFDPQSATAVSMELSRVLWVRCSAKKISSPQKYSSASRRAGSAAEKKFLPSEKSFTDFHWEWESRLEQVLKATDLLLQSGGFGLVAIDLGDIPLQAARRIPLTSWFRFRRAVEHTPTVLLVIGQEPCARACASLLLRLQALQVPGKICQAIGPQVLAHTQLLDGLHVDAEILRSRMERKPARSVTTSFIAKTAWAG